MLVTFVFSDQSGAKRRPALVVSSEAYHRGRQEAIIAAITSNVGRLLPGGHLVANWEGAGLLAPSVVTRIIRTIKQAIIQRKLGTLLAPDLRRYEDALREALALV